MSVSYIYLKLTILKKTFDIFVYRGLKFKKKIDVKKSLTLKNDPDFQERKKKQTNILPFENNLTLLKFLT